jgi:hypothetical protein
MRCSDRCLRGIISTEIVRDEPYKANTAGVSFNNSASPRHRYLFDKTFNAASWSATIALSV